MSLEGIRKSNFALLDSLTGKEQVGMDKQGRLYKVVVGEGAAPVFSKERESELKQLALDYALEHLSKKEFHEIETGTETYNNLVQKLTSLHLFSDEEKSTFAYMWYGQRYQDLVNSGIPEFVAEGQITIEMTCDPNILQKHKDIFSPVPTTTNESISGSYFIRDRAGNKIGVFKPMDEEPFMPNNPAVKYQSPYFPSYPMRNQIRWGHWQGEGWKKEVAACEIDENHFAGVPYTCKMEVSFPTSRGNTEIASKIGSFQQFVKGKPLTELTKVEIAAIPVSEIHKMAVFDLMAGNSDRHFGNCLWDPSAGKLYPIDHGFILLDSLDWKSLLRKSEAKFEWRVLKQASEPVDFAAKKWALDYDLDAVCERLKDKGISEGSIREHRLRVIFIKEGLRKGCTLGILGAISSGDKSLKSSVIEGVVNITKSKLDSNVQEEKVFFDQFVKDVQTFFDVQLPLLNM